jgi:hypothetical protein
VVDYGFESCAWKFTFGSNYVRVSTDIKRSECYFEDGVFADGKYFIDSAEIPTHYYEQDGTKQSFKELLNELN